MNAVRAALAALDVRRLAFAIHDASLPSAPEEDVGRGSPGSDEAARFFAFVRELGFDAIQLGPQGETDEGNPSPYDATWFSRSTLSIAWAPLARGERGAFPLGPEDVAALVPERDADERGHVEHRRVHAVQQRILDRVHAALRADSALAARRGAFVRAQGVWIERYALHDALSTGSDRAEGDGAAANQPTAALRARHASRIERYALGQLLAHEQHAAVRERLAALGLRLLGDVQIGASQRDRWCWPALFLPGYRLGAPPSRTNPQGQPWGYPLLDPRGAETGDPAFALFRARLAKLWDEYDGLRIDHPHGVIDPWVYRADDPDPFHAVQNGTRLFAAVGCPEHAALARYAIARPEDLAPDPATAHWAERWVLRLSPEQVARYAERIDALVAMARERGRGPDDIACEVLSTLPFPVAQVLARHGLGRFRVTQKAALTDAHDVYRSENAAPEDWIMVGTHDTAPIWRLADTWMRDGSADARARRLGERLAPAGARRKRLVEEMGHDPARLAQGYLAELFASPARHVMVFFSDAFGLREIYNEPGTVSERNWSLRLPAWWRRDYANRLARGRALDLPGALALALRARGLEREHAGLVERLERESAASRGS